MEVDNRMIHPIFQQLVVSGFVFSAKRWVASILRHSDKFQALISTTTPYTVKGGKDFFTLNVPRSTELNCILLFNS